MSYVFCGCWIQPVSASRALSSNWCTPWLCAWVWAMVPWLNNSGQGPWSPKIGQYFQNLGPTYCKLPLCSWCGDAVGTQWVGQWPTLKRIRGRFGRVPECDSSAWAELIARTKGPPNSFVHTSQWVGEFAPRPWYFCRVQTNREAKSHAGRRQWTLHTIVKKCIKKNADVEFIGESVRPAQPATSCPI